MHPQINIIGAKWTVMAYRRENLKPNDVEGEWSYLVEDLRTLDSFSVIEWIYFQQTGLS
jgi:hypothetical protein